MARSRVAAGVLVHDDLGHVLMVRPTYKEAWDIPGGYGEPDESPDQAAEREVAEELGLSPHTGPPASRRPVFASMPSDRRGTSQGRPPPSIAEGDSWR